MSRRAPFIKHSARPAACSFAKMADQSTETMHLFNACPFFCFSSFCCLNVHCNDCILKTCRKHKGISTIQTFYSVAGLYNLINFNCNTYTLLSGIKNNQYNLYHYFYTPITRLPRDPCIRHLMLGRPLGAFRYLSYEYTSGDIWIWVSMDILKPNFHPIYLFMLVLGICLYKKKISRLDL